VYSAFFVINNATESAKKVGSVSRRLRSGWGEGGWAPTCWSVSGSRGGVDRDRDRDGHDVVSPALRYDTRCYFNVRKLAA